MRLSLLAWTAAAVAAAVSSLLPSVCAQPASPPFVAYATAPSLAWSSNANMPSSSVGAWSRDGRVWFSVSPADGVTLSAMDVATGSQNWAVDLTTYTDGYTAPVRGARASNKQQQQRWQAQQRREASLQSTPTAFSCQPQLALSDDGALLYILCSLNSVALLSVSTATGSKVFSTAFWNAPMDFAPQAQLLWVQPANNPDPILLTVDANCALYGLNSATGALRWNLGLFHTDGTRCVLYVRDARNSTGLYNRLVNDANPQDQNQVMLSMSYPTAEQEAAAPDGVVRMQQQPQQQAELGLGNQFTVVRAVSALNPRVADPTSAGVARLFVLGSPQGSDLGSYTLEVLETDDRAVSAASWNASALSPALVASIIAAEDSGRRDGVQQNVFGNLLLPAMLFESALPITSLPSGLLAKRYPISFPISASEGGASLVFEPLHARVLLASREILAVFDASLPETADLRYIWSSARYLNPSMGVFPLQSEFAADVGAGAAPAQNDQSRRVRWIEAAGALSGGGGVMLSGVDSSGSPFASVFVSAPVAAALQCSTSAQFNSSCSACQLDSINLSPQTCGWCNATASCVQMFQQQCGTGPGAAVLVVPSNECAAAWPAQQGEHHEWYEQPAFWIVFAIFVAIVLAVMAAHIVAQRRAKHAAEVDGYLAAH